MSLDYAANTNLSLDFTEWKDLLTHIRENEKVYTFRSSDRRYHYLTVYLNKDMSLYLKICSLIGIDFTITLYKNFGRHQKETSFLSEINIKHQTNGKDNAPFEFVKNVWNHYVDQSIARDKKLLKGIIDGTES